MDENFEKELLKKFNTVIKLLTISSLKDEKQLQKIKVLSGAGLSPKDIADLLGTSSNTVSVALSNLKNKKEDKKTEDKSSSEQLRDDLND